MLYSAIVFGFALDCWLCVVGSWARVAGVPSQITLRSSPLRSVADASFAPRLPVLAGFAGCSFGAFRLRRFA